VCLKTKQVIRDEEEYARYQTALAEYPEFIDEDYDPYESVCIEWGTMADVSPIDRFLYAMEPNDTPLLTMLGKKDAEAQTITWGWGDKEDSQ
jgi:hypothetical protein